ncbi:hypothetical protein BuS5_01310 [Desulfosarcina sp. BuS5]|uniref:type VII toxin-antitoxin system HepT family RNase toxin n=1 Tax=Desulfosarcina sp. BuS5 TaxID=933262 RepID=UPI00048651B0|nr:DUF86 domain-containing protein [Desulfosarcina sp. BuS5]WDN88342.1 hypothetical protein BuS5_01310 [Desulfosarcina sp. BuS5]
MPLFDQDIILKLVSELRKSIIRLREISKLSQKDFLGDQDKIGSSKYHFIVAIESTIDMCNHIIARNGYRMPENYADTFKVMAEAGAIDADFSNALRSMAKFRNRLVNLYWEVDDQQLYKILQEHLVDFKKILNSITDFLEWEKY